MTTSRIQHFKGMLFMICAAFCTSINLLLGKSILGSLSVPWVVILRFIVPFFLLFWVAVVSGFPKFPSKDSWRPMLIRCFFFFLTQYFIFWYLLHGSYVIASVLTCTTPIFVPIVDRFFYNHHMSYKMWISVVFSFLGILLILQPGGEIWNNWALLGLLSGFFSALGQVSFNQVAKKERPQDTAFYLFLFGSIFAIIITFFVSNQSGYELFKKLLEERSIDWTWLAFGFITVMAQLFRSKSYACVNKTGSVAPLSYFTIIFSALFSWYFFDQVFGFISWAGVLLVAVGGFILLHRNKVQKGVL